MIRLLRLLRGAIGMGLTWALAWSAAGMVFRLIAGKGSGDLPFPIQFGLFGFFSGVTFSGVVSVVASRRRFDEMSLGRFAGWGALGGLVLYGLLAVTAGPGGEPLILLPVFSFAGAGSAAGTLALARRAGAPTLMDAEASIESADSAAGHLP